jgi:iron complex transport system ATP-binding protein
LEDVHACYGKQEVLHGISLAIPKRSFSIVVGPNGSGKTTMIRVMSGLTATSTGTVWINGAPIKQLSRRSIARQVAVLAQTNEAPPGIEAYTLISRARFPHTSLLRQWSRDDEDAVLEALASVGASSLIWRRLDELSGGQRQRVWLAALLAQQTKICLLDEPTTYLDISAQQETLQILRSMIDRGGTVLAAIHDLNLARLADHLVIMRNGQVIAQGPPATTFRAELLSEAYDAPLRAVTDPVSRIPLIVVDGQSL